MTNPSGAKVDYSDFNDDTTEFVKKLKRVLADINIRIAAVENIKGMVDEFERRYGEVALHRIEAAIAPVLQTMLDGLAETRAALAALDEDYRTNGQQRVDGIINPLIAQVQAALAIATGQMEELEEFLILKQSVSERGQANGYASLGADGKIPASQLPAALFGGLSYQGTWNANANAPVIPTASAANKGYYYKVTTAGSTNVSGETDWKVGDWIVSNGASWDKADHTDQVMSVAGLVGVITAAGLKTALALVKADVGLGSVDNTPDSGKPVSTAQQNALNGKVSKTGDTVSGGFVGASVDDGVKSSGTYTPSPTGGNFRHITNNGPIVIAAPTALGDFVMIIEVTNGATAGAVTISGMIRSGYAFTTTNGHKFRLHITKMNGTVSVFVEAMQ